MNFLIDSFGNYSSKRLAGLTLIATGCLGFFQTLAYNLTGFDTLILGVLATGAGLLGSTMIERKSLTK